MYLCLSVVWRNLLYAMEVGGYSLAEGHLADFSGRQVW